MTDTALEDFVGRVRPARAANILLWVILAFLAFFVVWAALAKIDKSKVVNVLFRRAELAQYALIRPGR